MKRRIAINLNDVFEFKLTPYGMAIDAAEARAKGLARFERIPDKDGYLSDQLWQIAHDYGSYIFMGASSLPIETNLVALVEVPEFDAELQALSDQIHTYFAQGSTLREALGVSVEPHQSLFERVLEKIETDGRDAARYRLLRTRPYFAEENHLAEGEELDSALDFLLEIGEGLDDFDNSAWRHWYLTKHGKSMHFESNPTRGDDFIRDRFLNRPEDKK